MVMELYIVRMIREKEDLSSKIKKLNNYMNDHQKDDPKRIVLMGKQLDAMKDYLFYLDERLNYELKKTGEVVEWVKD